VNDFDPAQIHFGADGLVPAVVQDAVSGDVLMLAFMNAEALQRTLDSGRAHYWSRSRGKFWRKGESSGHEQLVAEIRVNCERNSLLLLVHQIGAVCHEGFPTCYFRRLEEDGTLTVVRERAFDPVQIYGSASQEVATATPHEIDRLAEATRQQYGAYAFLRDNELGEVSKTSRRLHDRSGRTASRIAEELRELSGVIEGTHRHSDRDSDLRLEATQVIHWIFLFALQNGVTWSRLRPDLGLLTGDEGLAQEIVTRLLNAEADRWEEPAEEGADVAARTHATLALVGQVCRCWGIDPLDVVEADLAELQSRPYLAPYFGP
jgi:phosphoribosyl-AMP cyclohydrolase